MAYQKIDQKLIERIKQIPMESVLEGKKFRISGNKKIYPCFFHNETKGSFVLYPTNTYHCFGCQKNGDIIKFIQDYCDVNFQDAVEYLRKYI